MTPGACARCVVVADDSLVRWSLVRFLETRCLEARSAGSGELALALLQEWPVELLIADVRLAGMNGLELVQRCQRLRPRPGFVLCRETGDPPLPDNLDRLGVIGVIEKPLILESLSRVLVNVLQNPGGAAG